MSGWQAFLVGLEMLRLHKLRALLTMLGVIIGVMAVTIIVMVSSGFTYFMTNEFKKLGTDTIVIAYDGWRRGRGETTGGISGLTNEDVDYLMQRVSSLDIAAPIIEAPRSPVRREDHELKNPRIFASNQFFADLNRLELSSGRYFTKEDIDNRSNICIVGEEVSEKLFPKGDAIGGSISFAGISLEVVGVFKRLEMMGETNARDILLPITTAQDKWMGGRYVSMITTRPKSGFTVEETMDDVWRALMLKSGNRNIYRVDSREAILQVFTAIFGVAGVILAAIAALSLLVGGIGIMNIMLVSVTERTREIGLRKAVGAKRGTILLQFLIESATLSLIGGLIGMSLAWLIGSSVTWLTAMRSWPSEGGLPTPFPAPAAIGAALFSALIGVVFGLYPAISASKLDPIEALRRE